MKRRTFLTNSLACSALPLIGSLPVHKEPDVFYTGIKQIDDEFLPHGLQRGEVVLITGEKKLRDGLANNIKEYNKSKDIQIVFDKVGYRVAAAALTTRRHRLNVDNKLFMFSQKQGYDFIQWWSAVTFHCSTEIIDSLCWTKVEIVKNRRGKIGQVILDSERICVNF